jgi:hypothetical protein
MPSPKMHVMSFHENQIVDVLAQKLEDRLPQGFYVDICDIAEYCRPVLHIVYISFGRYFAGFLYCPEGEKLLQHLQKCVVTAGEVESFLHTTCKTMRWHLTTTG